MAATEHDTPDLSAGVKHLLLARSGEQTALRSASSPARDLCLLTSSTDPGSDLTELLAQCEVLDVSPGILTEELQSTLGTLPALKALRLITGAGEEPIRVSAFPSAPTLVYLAPPETLIDLKPKAGDMGPFPICSPETRRLVLNFPPTTDEQPKYRPKGRRPDVDHVVCVMHDGAGDEAHTWINWAVRYEIETTVVLYGGDFEAKRAALGEQVDLHHIHVQVLPEEDYREQVDAEAFGLETQRFLSLDAAA